MKTFKSSRKLLADLDAGSAARLIEISSDIALVIDKKGVIRDIACEGDSGLAATSGDWLGRAWIDTVTVESRPKIAELIETASDPAAMRWRQVNHPAAAPLPDVPVSYATLEVGRDGRILALGRDLKSMAALQMQVLDAQRQMEREVSRVRQIETRYRALFHLTSEPVFIIDATTLKVVELNPAANALLVNGTRRLAGRTFLDLFDRSSVTAVQTLMASIRAEPKADDVEVMIAGRSEPLVMSASLFRYEDAAHILVRMQPPAAREAAMQAEGRARRNLDRILAALPDAFVVIDNTRTVLSANRAFLEMTQLAAEPQVRGQPVDRWIGRADVDVNVLMANLREHGAVRKFSTAVRGEFGARLDVEITAVSVTESGPPVSGLILRKAESAAPAAGPASASLLPRTVDQMTALVGRVPLKELVRETTDIIERLCIEAALELTGDNRASAAEMLGLSRQSLYMKLRRYGLSDSE